MSHWLITFLCGSIVGCTLGLIGGGGSILAVPLLLYAVRIRDAHVAIGTSALAVGTNAAVNTVGDWRLGNVKLPCAIAFAIAGLVGALAGSTLGKAVDGRKLMILFAFAMLAVGIAMLRQRRDTGDPGVHINRAMSEQGTRLRIDKATLRDWRRRFAQRLDARGVPANATERAVRGRGRNRATFGPLWIPSLGMSSTARRPRSPGEHDSWPRAMRSSRGGEPRASCSMFRGIPTRPLK